MPALAVPRTKATGQRVRETTTLGLGWDLVNELATSTIRTLVYDQTGHLDGVCVSGSMSTRGNTSAATVPVRSSLVGLVPVVDGTGSTWLLDLAHGRSARVLSDWSNTSYQQFRDRITIVTIDGFAGYRTSTAAAVPAVRIWPRRNSSAAATACNRTPPHDGAAPATRSIGFVELC